LLTFETAPFFCVYPVLAANNMLKVFSVVMEMSQ
jgi:hypothetical protein